MLLKDHKDLKNAITAIPVREKDKLLLRLIAKDKVLTEHLHFKLLEDESDLEDRVLSLQDEIDSAIAELSAIKKGGAKEALVVLRKLNGRVNHHYKVTRDMLSEITLRLRLLNRIPMGYQESIFSAQSKFNDRLRTYFVRTTFALYKKYQKLHEDLQFDLKEQFNGLLNKLDRNKLSRAAHELGLPEEL